MQRMHDRARRGDLLLGDAAIRLGDMAHDPEGGREEQRVDLHRIGAAAISAAAQQREPRNQDVRHTRHGRTA